MADNNMFNQQIMPMAQQYMAPLPTNGTSYPYPQQQIQNTQTYQNDASNSYGRYQQAWQMPTQQQQNQQIQYQQQSENTEYILIPGSSPGKMKKYILVGEVDMQTNAVNPLPSFSLEDIRKTVAHEFDVRFGEEKKP